MVKRDKSKFFNYSGNISEITEFRVMSQGTFFVANFVGYRKGILMNSHKFNSFRDIFKINYIEFFTNL